MKQRKKVNPKSLANLKPFEKGDSRINRAGRPKSFDELRSLFQDIAAEEITLNGKKYTRAQAIGLAMSMDKKMMRDFLEFAFGKPTEKVDLSNSDGTLAPKIPDEERLARMKELAVMIAKEVRK